MKAKLLLSLLAAAAVAIGGGIVGFNALQAASARRARSDELLQEARDAMAEASQSANAAAARDLRAKAAQKAREAVDVSDANAFEAAMVQGEAWLLSTRYREAISAFDKALTLQPKDARAAELEATAHHRAFEIGKKPADLGAALSLYDRAAEAGAPPRVLLAAATLAQLAGEVAESDRYLERLDQAAPDGDEAKAGRELRAARAAASKPR